MTPSLSRYKQDFSLVEYPLIRLLGLFGDITPFLIPSARSSDRLEVRFLNYFTLTKVAMVEVQWVDSLNLHLEFDEAMKTLKLFRFPSFCRITCSLDHSSPLHNMFKESASTRDNEDDEAENMSHVDAGKHALEVLMSYRLIFGQDEKSWNAYKKNKVYRKKRSRESLSDHDPLLDRLCGQNWRKEAKFYLEIKSLDAAYLPSSELPYLGEKLLRLQNFCEAQNPRSWSILWCDRRNLIQYYTFWSFIYVAVLTIVVGCAQIVLAAVALQK